MKSWRIICWRLISDFGGGLPGRWGRCGGLRCGRFGQWIILALNRTFEMRPRFNRDCFMNDIAFHARRRGRQREARGVGRRGRAGGRGEPLRHRARVAAGGHVVAQPLDRLRGRQPQRRVVAT